MAFVVADRVKETTTTEGTGDISLGGAVSGYQAFGDVMSDTDTCPYAIVDRTTGDYETGEATYNATADSLTRDTVKTSSNAGSTVDFGSGTKTVGLVPIEDRLPVADADPADNDVLVWNNTEGTWKPEAQTSGGSPGGSDTQFQYNNGGSFGGTTGFIWNDTNGNARLNDDVEAQFGTAPDYRLRYDSTNGQLELVSEDIDGTGTAGDILRVGDGQQDLEVVADILFSGLTGTPNFSTHDHSEGGLTTIPNAGLTNSSITVTAGDGLKNGGAVSLGGSTTLNVEPADYAGTGLADDGADNLELNRSDINVYNAERFTGTDGGAQIQAALDAADNAAGRSVVYVGPLGSDTGNLWLASSTITIGTETTLVLDGCTLKLADAVDNNLLSNKAHDATGNPNISVVCRGDVLIDGNAAGQSRTSGDANAPKWTCLEFYNCDGFSWAVPGRCVVRDTAGWGMKLEETNNFYVGTIEWDQQNNVDNQDGIHVVGEAINGVIDDQYGSTTDDMVAVESGGLSDAIEDSRGGHVRNIQIGKIQNDEFRALRLMTGGNDGAGNFFDFKRVSCELAKTTDDPQGANIQPVRMNFNALGSEVRSRATDIYIDTIVAGKGATNRLRGAFNLGAEFEYMSIGRVVANGVRGFNLFRLAGGGFDTLEVGEIVAQRAGDKPIIGFEKDSTFGTVKVGDITVIRENGDFEGTETDTILFNTTNSMTVEQFIVDSLTVIDQRTDARETLVTANAGTTVNRLRIGSADVLAPNDQITSFLDVVSGVTGKIENLFADAEPGTPFANAGGVSVSFERQTNRQTLGADLSLNYTDAPIQNIDPGGAARNVDLPAEVDGLVRVIANRADAAEAITVREDSATTTIATVNQNEVAKFICDGTGWMPIAGSAATVT